MKKRESENDILTLQKEAVKHDIESYFALSLVMLILAIIMPIVCFLEEDTFDWSVWYFIFVSFFSISLCMFFVFRRRPLLKKLKSIESSDEQTVSVNCSKVSLSYTTGKWTKASFVLCVTITDDEGRKYYYVFPLENAPHMTRGRKIKKKLVGNPVELICYQGTNIVKQVPTELKNIEYSWYNS